MLGHKRHKSMRLSVVLTLMAILVLSSCKQENNEVFPRRYAYPRVEAYDTVYTRVALGPVDILVNAGAESVSPRVGWLNVSYPRYGATIHLSATRTDNPAEAIANRRQRISLNLGGATAVTHRFSNGDFECLVVESADAGTTPVQMLAVSDRGVIVSGTASLSGRTSPADSIRPIVKALSRDAVKMLLSIE